MPPGKYIYRLLLALMLLGCIPVANRNVGEVYRTPAFAESTYTSSAHKAESAKDGQYPAVISISHAPLLPIIITGGDGGRHIPAWPTIFCLLLSCISIALCTKSGLKQRLHALLRHYTFQQQILLFPKHGFW